MCLWGNDMTQSMYVVGDNVFTNDDNSNPRQRAYAYAKSNSIDKSEVLEARNDVELDYIKYLKGKGARHLSTHDKVLVLQGFTNAKDQFIPPMVEDIPFHYIDDEGIHYEWVVGSIYDLNNRLVYTKVLFDLFNRLEDCYLKLIYLDTDGTYKEFNINEIELLRNKFSQTEHKKMLEKRRALREIQVFERLRQLRSEGRITEKQTKTLYRLEALYGKKG